MRVSMKTRSRVKSHWDRVKIMAFQLKLVRQFYLWIESFIPLFVAVETKISVLEEKLKNRPEFSIETVLKGNDKLTRFYTGMPNYHLFLALAKYLEPKALQLRAWRSSYTIMNSNMDELCRRRSISRCFMSFCVTNQLFAVLMWLWRGLESSDVCIWFKIHKWNHLQLHVHYVDFIFIKGIKSSVSIPYR